MCMPKTIPPSGIKNLIDLKKRIVKSSPRKKGAVQTSQISSGPIGPHMPKPRGGQKIGAVFLQ